MAWWDFKSTSEPTPQVTEMVQRFPELADGVKSLQDLVKQQTAALDEMRSSSDSTPTQIRNLDIGVRDLRAKTVQAMTNFYALRDQWREAIAEAKRQGSLSTADFMRLQDAGLAGLRGLGVFFVIGWPLAAAIAAILVPAAFVAAYSLTAESRAAAQAIADQNAAVIDEWRRRASSGDPSSPLPEFVQPPGVKNNSSSATAAAAAGGALTLLLVAGVALWFFTRRKK